MSIFTFIRAAKFFPKYCPKVTNWTHKMRGVDGNGKPITWTKEDKKAIRRGLRAMIRDAIKNI